MPGFPVHQQLTELAQIHVHRVSDAIQPSHPLLSPSPLAFNLSQHQGLFQWPWWIIFYCVDHNKLWKILKEMGIPDHLTCLLRNLYTGQEATVRTGQGTMDRFLILKRVCQGCILSPCLFNLYAEYIMRNTGLDEAKLESELQGEISVTSDMQMTPP